MKYIVSFKICGKSLLYFTFSVLFFFSECCCPVFTTNIKNCRLNFDFLSSLQFFLFLALIHPPSVLYLTSFQVSRLFPPLLVKPQPPSQLSLLVLFECHRRKIGLQVVRDLNYIIYFVKPHP